MRWAVLALAIVLTSGASRAGAELNPPDADATSPPSTSTAMANVDIVLPYQAGSVAASAGSIWVIPHLNEVVLRIDPATNRVVEEIALPNVVGAEIDANDEAVWVSVSTPGSFSPAGVVRIAAATGAVTGPFTVEGVDEVFPRIAPDGVWVGGAGRFARLDVTSGALLEVVNVPGEGGHLPTTEGLWLAHEDGIWSVDPSTGTVDEVGQAVAELRPGQFGPPYLPVAESDGRVWGVGADSVIALDVSSHEVAITVDLPDELSPCPDGAISESVFWLIAGSGTCSGNTSVLIGIDTTTGAVIREEPLEFSPEFGMEVTADSVWVPVVRALRIVRIPIEE